MLERLLTARACFLLPKSHLMIKQSRYQRTYAVAAAVVMLLAAEPTAAGTYAIDYLIDPYHPDVVDSWLFGINNQGASTGYTVIHPAGGPFTRAVVAYAAGNSEVVATGTSGDPFGLVGFALNNGGDIIGNVDDVPTFISAGGVSTPIEVPDRFVSLFVAGLLHGGINDTGNALVAAFPLEPNPAPTGALSGLALWNPGGSTLLSSLDPLYPFVNPPDINDFNSGPSSGVYTASVTGLNNADQFAAGLHKTEFDPVDPNNFDDDAFSDVFTQAYVYDGQGGYALLASAAPGEEIRPIDIDEVGTVFGWSGTHLALWGVDGALQSVLPEPAVTLDDFGYNGFPTVQRNSLGQVVGVTVDGGVLFYDPLANNWTDVTPMIASLGAGTFSTIQGFNDSGQFVGLARPPQGGGIFGYVVSPVPEPSSLAAWGVGLIHPAARWRKLRAKQ
jgi:hypothetical protein